MKRFLLLLIGLVWCLDVGAASVKISALPLGTTNTLYGTNVTVMDLTHNTTNDTYSVNLGYLGSNWFWTNVVLQNASSINGNLTVNGSVNMGSFQATNASNVKALLSLDSLRVTNSSQFDGGTQTVNSAIVLNSTPQITTLTASRPLYLDAGQNMASAALNVTTGNGISLLNASNAAAPIFKSLTNTASTGITATDQGTNVLLALASIPNTAFANSSVTVNGTANQVNTTSAAIALGGSATLSLSSTLVAPGSLGVTGLTSLTSATNNGYYAGLTSTLAYVGGTNVIVDLAVADNFLLTMTNTTWMIFSNITQGRSGFVHILTNGTAQTLSYGASSVSHILTNASITGITNQTIWAWKSSFHGTNVAVVSTAGFQ